ncbi:hypothetical protein V8C26DRAFT_399109 [Trichoderma gracile]
MPTAIVPMRIGTNGALSTTTQAPWPVRDTTTGARIEFSGKGPSSGAEAGQGERQGHLLQVLWAWDGRRSLPFSAASVHAKQAGHQAIHPFYAPWILCAITSLRPRPAAVLLASCPSARTQSAVCCLIRDLSASVSVLQVCAHQLVLPDHGNCFRFDWPHLAYDRNIFPSASCRAEVHVCLISRGLGLARDLQDPMLSNFCREGTR